MQVERDKLSFFKYYKFLLNIQNKVLQKIPCQLFFIPFIPHLIIQNPSSSIEWLIVNI